LKKDYLSGVGDSLDLVVVGAYYGKGKRTNVYGAFLLACYDPDSEHFQTICKIGTGFSEEVLLQFYELLRPLETQVVRGDIEAGGAKPEIWFEPKIVWEVLTADLSLSPVYTAAHGIVSAPFSLANWADVIGRESRYLITISKVPQGQRR
jgi:DNA ligase-1